MLFTITPAALPEGYGQALVPLEDVKAWIGALSDDNDALIETLRDAAIDFVEQYTGVRMGPVTGMTASFAGFGPGMRVGVGPAGTLSVTAVSYLDSEGETVDDLEEGDWRIDPSGALLPAIGACWPVSYGTVTVTFDAGYPADACPASLKAAVKMFAANLFENREAVITGTIAEEAPLGVTAMCDRYRMPVI